MVKMLLKAVAVEKNRKVEILERFRREKHQSLADRWTWELEERKEESSATLRFLAYRISTPYRCLCFYYFSSGSIIFIGYLLSAFSEPKSMLDAVDRKMSETECFP